MRGRDEIRLRGRISRRDDGLWIAVIQEIPIASCGRTREEAWRNADNAVNGWFHAHERAGTFTDVVKEYGLKVVPAEIEDTPFEARYLVPA